MSEQIAAPTARIAHAPAPAPGPVQLRRRRVALDALTTGYEQQLRHAAGVEARLARLRLYSYCLTLSACVLALMAFMYLTQGVADADPTFVWLGIAFSVGVVLALWLAVRITRVGIASPAHPTD